MLKSNASRGVLVILLAIGAFELGITGKFGKVWSLAFTGDPNKSSSKRKAKKCGLPPNPNKYVLGLNDPQYLAALAAWDLCMRTA